MRRIALIALCGLAVAVPALAQDKLPLGSRVGNSAAGAAAAAVSGYDDGGRRDPFVSPIAPKKAAAPNRPRLGLISLSISEVVVKGIVRNGPSVVAILEGPDGKSFVAHNQDKLQDAVVKSIDLDGVVFVAQIADAFGVMHARDVRKSLRPPAIEGAR